MTECINEKDAGQRLNDWVAEGNPFPASGTFSPKDDVA